MQVFNESGLEAQSKSIKFVQEQIANSLVEVFGVEPVSASGAKQVHSERALRQLLFKRLQKRRERNENSIAPTSGCLVRVTRGILLH